MTIWQSPPRKVVATSKFYRVQPRHPLRKNAIEIVYYKLTSYLTNDILTSTFPK